MTALALFGSTFLAVFALGFQSLNVNRGHYVAAFITSFAIAGGNLVLFKVVPGELAGVDVAAYFLGGPFGIVASMFAHRHVMRRKKRCAACGTKDTGVELRGRWHCFPCAYNDAFTLDKSPPGNINCGADRP